jgi:hypothetical protein
MFSQMVGGVMETAEAASSSWMHPDYFADSVRPQVKFTCKCMFHRKESYRFEVASSADQFVTILWEVHFLTYMHVQTEHLSECYSEWNIIKRMMILAH